MNQEQLKEALNGKKIVNINFATDNPKDITITGFSLEGGELLELGEETRLSHPECEAEWEAFKSVLENIPASGIVSFKAKYLNPSQIDQALAKKHKEIKALGFGPFRETRQDYLAYRFDMPE